MIFRRYFILNYKNEIAAIFYKSLCFSYLICRIFSGIFFVFLKIFEFFCIFFEFLADFEFSFEIYKCKKQQLLSPAGYLHFFSRFAIFHREAVSRRFL